MTHVGSEALVVGGSNETAELATPRGICAASASDAKEATNPQNNHIVRGGREGEHSRRMPFSADHRRLCTANLRSLTSIM